MALKFELGKYYIHNAGKMIYIHGELDTYAWGHMFIIEECHPTDKGVEHYISAIIKDGNDHSENWTEIGEAEFKRNFPKVDVLTAKEVDLRMVKAGLN